MCLCNFHHRSGGDTEKREFLRTSKLSYADFFKGCGSWCWFTIRYVKDSALARNSCCSSGCTFSKWGNVLQRQIILQCHLSGNALRAFTPPNWSTSVPRVIGFISARCYSNFLCSPLIVVSSQLKRRHSRLFKALASETQALVSCCLAMMETKQKQALDPFYWNVRNILSDSWKEGPQWLNNSWISRAWNVA